MLFDDAASEYLEAGLTVGADPLTLSAWCNTDTGGAQDQSILIVADTDGLDLLQLYLNDTDTKVHSYAYDGSNVLDATCSTTHSTGTWHYMCAVLATTTDNTVYQDGGNAGQDTSPATTLQNIDNTTVGVLKFNNLPQNYFSGYIDEARASSAARSADWVAYEHANMGGNADYEQTWSAEESKPAAGGGVPAWMHFYKMRNR